jgi:hypothetical protein
VIIKALLYNSILLWCIKNIMDEITSNAEVIVEED